MKRIEISIVKKNKKAEEGNLKKADRTNKKQDEPFIHLAFWAKNMHSLIGFVHKRLSFSSKSLLI